MSKHKQTPNMEKYNARRSRMNVKAVLKLCCLFFMLFLALVYKSPTVQSVVLPRFETTGPTELAIDYQGLMANVVWEFYAGIQLARKHNAKFCLWESSKYPHYVEDLFGREVLPPPCEGLVYRHYEKGYANYQEFKIVPGRLNLLTAYLQSWKYINSSDFYPVKSKWLVLAKEQTGDVPYVAVHARIGDKGDDRSYRYPGKRFFQNVRKYFVPSQRFLVVAQHRREAIPTSKMVKTREIIANEDEMYVDFGVLCNAEAIVSTRGSTFAWWASVLYDIPMFFMEDEVVLEHPKQREQFSKENYYYPGLHIPI